MALLLPLPLPLRRWLVSVLAVALTGATTTTSSFLSTNGADRRRLLPPCSCIPIIKCCCCCCCPNPDIDDIRPLPFNDPPEEAEAGEASGAAHWVRRGCCSNCDCLVVPLSTTPLPLPLLTRRRPVPYPPPGGLSVGGRWKSDDEEEDDDAAALALAAGGRLRRLPALLPLPLPVSAPPAAGLFGNGGGCHEKVAIDRRFRSIECVPRMLARGCVCDPALSGPLQQAGRARPLASSAAVWLLPVNRVAD